MRPDVTHLWLISLRSKSSINSVNALNLIQMTVNTLTKIFFFLYF